jgi:hypothetical protein
LFANALYSGAGASTAHLPADRIIYNTTNGDLFYDPDGSGSIAATEFGVLDTHPTISYTNFFVV